MPYVDFHSAFPAVAEAETRSVTLPRTMSGLPAGTYTFVEMFCDEVGCDCRRVFFLVVASPSKPPVAVIAYGWEDRAYYFKWMGVDDPRIIDDLKGPVLNLASPQSSLAPAVLALFEEVLLPDAAYIDRVKRHYAMFRQHIDRRQPQSQTRRPKKRKTRRKA
jgi:hypothetical protein